MSPLRVLGSYLYLSLSCVTVKLAHTTRRIHDGGALSRSTR